MKALRLAVTLILVGCGVDKQPLDGTLAKTEAPLVTSKLPDIYQCYYKITLADSTSVVTIKSDGYSQPSSYNGGLNQRFIIIPQASDTDWFYAVPLSTGGPAIIRTDSNNRLFSRSAYPGGGTNELFWLSDASVFPRRFYIRPLYNSEYIANVLPSAWYGLRSWSSGNRFTFDCVGSFPHPMPQLRTGTAEPGAIGDIPRLTSYSTTPPTSSSPVLIGEMLVPFVYVKEAGTAWQAQNSPYYRLVRQQYWRRAGLGEKPAGVGDATTWKATTGMSRSDSVTVETTINTVIKGDGRLEFTKDWLKASLGASMERDIKVVTTLASTTTYTESKEISRSVAFPQEKRVRWAAWYLVDRYTLFRMDGSQVNATWELVYEDPRFEILDAYME